MLETAAETVLLLKEWMLSHPAVPLAAGIFSAAAFFGTLGGIPLLIVRIPKDYFLRDEYRWGPDTNHFARLLVLTAKNIAGAVCGIAGVAMLVLPGQGLLTILVAVMLLDFPGKRTMERNIIRYPQVRRAVNGLREKAGKELLELPELPEEKE